MSPTAVVPHLLFTRDMCGVYMYGTQTQPRGTLVSVGRPHYCCAVITEAHSIYLIYIYRPEIKAQIAHFGALCLKNHGVHKKSQKRGLISVDNNMAFDLFLLKKRAPY